MSEIILVEIQFNSRTWFLSEEGYVGEDYYAPNLSSSPTLELGEVKGGYIGVRLGDLSIANRPNDRFSPFSIFGGGYQKLMDNPNQKIPVQIYWQQGDDVESLFDGTMYLSGFNIDEFTFLLEDKISDVDLLSTARDFESDFVSINSISVTGEGGTFPTATALVSAPDHDLKTGDFVKMSECTSVTEYNTFSSEKNEIIPVEIEVIDDNFFRYTLINGANGASAPTDFVRSFEYLMETYTQKPEPFSFGYIKRKKDIIKINERDRDFLGDYSGAEYSNPDLIHNDVNNPIFLYDDGVLVGSTDNTRFGNLASGISVVGIIKNGDYLEISTGVAGVSGADHNLEIGSTVALFGFTPDEINTSGPYYIVADVIDSRNFKIYIRLSSEIVVGLGSSPIIKTPGEYFGVDRMPTAEKIYSRALFTDLGTYNSSDSSTVRNIGGVDYTSFDGTVIYGTPLVTGMSSNGETLAEFFEYIANRLDIDNVDFSDGINASSIRLQLWETSQTKLLEYAGDISYSANYLFEIKNNILRVIDRSSIPENHTFIDNWEIVECSYKMPTPVKALRVKWTENIVNPKTIPNSLSTREESVMISNMESGEILDISPVTENQNDAVLILTKIKDIINKNVITIKIGRIRPDIKTGQRIKANRDEDGVSIDMIVRTISYDFSDMSTEIVGDGILFVIEQDQIY